MTAGQYGRSNPFEGPGETRALARDIDWSRTSLGPVESWSPVLRSTVRTCLDSPFPTNLWCGPELVLIYNDGYRAVLGAKHPGALGRRGAEVWGEIWEQIQPMFEQIRSGGPPVYAEDAPFLVRRARSPQPGEQEAPNAWFTFALSPVREESGEIVAYLNTVAETTSRILAERAREAARARAERAEARLLDVFAQAPAFLALLRGEDHIFEFVNSAYYQLIGHRDVIGRPVFEALPEVRGQGFEDLLEGVLRTGVPYVGREAPIELSRTPGAEPEQRFVDFVYYPITEVDGTRSGVVAHGSDVTEHVLARREAQRARTEAEEANRAKSQFLANMSHEIRTPINAIIGYTELLELGLTGPVTRRQGEQLERIRVSGKHLLSLIDDILDLAKAESGHVQVAHDHLTAEASITAGLALITPQAAQRGISVESSCTPEPRTTYYGDEDRVRQILANLLSNAVKFTGTGGQIVISCGVEDQPPWVEGADGHPFAFISVRDTGIGISAEKLEDVFEPFMQIEAGHTRTRGGTGLGLTISRHLARLMGGELTASSEPGRGSTFTLWLPTRPDAAPLTESVLEQAGDRLPSGLAEVGRALKLSLEEVLARFTARVRADPAVPMAKGLDTASIEDHAASLLADIGQGIASLEQGGFDVADFLRDGTEIQQLISRLHGEQRARLGWTEEAMRREFEILREEIEAMVRRELALDSVQIDAAVSVLVRFVEHAERVSLRGWRQGSTSEVMR